MPTVRRGLVVGLLAQTALFAVIATTVPLGGAGWVAAVTCAVLVVTWITRGLARYAAAIGPADLVTWTRVTLACAVAALVADGFWRERDVRALVALAAIALALDAIDGPVARLTRTASPFGARFDGEADAFLILVLSIDVARAEGTWVLAIGAARYLFALAGWPLPWMRAELPPRYWRKVVAATQGIVLVVAAADIAADPVTRVGLLLAAILLGESFGRDVVWLARRRGSRAEVDHGCDVRPERRAVARG